VSATPVREVDAVRESHVAATQAQRPHLQAVGVTDVGERREANEDSFAVAHRHGLFMVADGMGAHNAGEVAAKMAIDCVGEAFDDVGATPSTALLIAGLQRANHRIARRARREPDKKGMGTTFVGLLVLENRVVIAHVGDSRAYRLRGDRLDLLTEDHSLLNSYIRAGEWDPANSHNFPLPSYITRAVGTEDDLAVDTQLRTLAPGDVYLLCSDGLTDMVGGAEVVSTLRKYQDLTQAAQRLVDAANARGGHDNITVVLVRWLGG
jgi:serine/threonine protein phosphatase PrpC